MSNQNGKSAANGTAKITAPVVALNPKATETEPKQELSTLQVVASEAKEPEKSTLSLDDIFYRMDMLFSLRLKLGKLKSTLDKLISWKASTDTRNDQIILTDQNGNTFNTFNPAVVAKTVEWLKEDIAQKITECEADIRKLL